MKIGLKAVSVLIVALSVSVLFFTKKAQKPIETKRLPAVRAVNENSGIAPTPTQSPRPTTTVPTGISFKPVELGTARVQLQPLIDVVSNAVLSVDRILKAKDYQVQEFSRTKWLIAIDKAHSTVWRIFPYKTNSVIGTVEAIVYNDAAMTNAWSNTLSCASPTGMCEVGFQILLNTTNGTYECEPVIYGDVMPSTNALGSITAVVLPNVSEVFPGLTAPGMVYWVARFHTHTTTEYWPPPPPPAQIVRDIGPSPTDLSHVNGIPSVVFDYIEAPESYQPQTIYNGWPKTSPAKLYTYGPTRRATP